MTVTGDRQIERYRLGYQHGYEDRQKEQDYDPGARHPDEAPIRAQVIKADIPSTDRRAVLLFWVEFRKGWASTDLLMWGTNELTNVTVIVDKYGNIRS